MPVQQGRAEPGDLWSPNALRPAELHARKSAERQITWQQGCGITQPE
jgi:hypothetical protein